MFENENRASLRQQFFDAFDKASANKPLSLLEAVLVDVIQMHPEYLHYLKQKETYLEKDFHPEAHETNPFLHMGAHIGLREQVGTNRPKGITQLYKRLVAQYQGDVHRAEHALMDIMMETLWTAQKNNEAPSEKQYIKKCRKLLK